MHKIISDRSINYILVIPVLAVSYIILHLLFVNLFGWENGIGKILCLSIACAGTFGKNVTVPGQEDWKLMFFGEEVPGVRLGPGFYFLFWGMWGIFGKEKQGRERRSFAILNLNCQDLLNKFLIASLGGYWAIGETEAQKSKYQIMDAKDVPGLIVDALRRAMVRVVLVRKWKPTIPGESLIAGQATDKPFIAGQDIRSIILEEVKPDLDDMGVVIPRLYAEVESGDLKQDNMNYYILMLDKMYIDMYGDNLKAKDRADLVQLSLKNLTRVTTGGGANVIFRDNIGAGT